MHVHVMVNLITLTPVIIPLWYTTTHNMLDSQSPMCLCAEHLVKVTVKGKSEAHRVYRQTVDSID